MSLPVRQLRPFPHRARKHTPVGPSPGPAASWPFGRGLADVSPRSAGGIATSARTLDAAGGAAAQTTERERRGNEMARGLLAVAATPGRDGRPGPLDQE